MNVPKNICCVVTLLCVLTSGCASLDSHCCSSNSYDSAAVSNEIETVENKDCLEKTVEVVGDAARATCGVAINAVMIPVGIVAFPFVLIAMGNAFK